MAKVFVSCGFGPGVATGVAKKFAKEMGLKVALLSRTQAKLEAAAAQFKEEGIDATPIVCDFGNAESIKVAWEQVKPLGEIAVVHYNAVIMNFGNILTAPAKQLQDEFAVAIVGMNVMLSLSAAALEQTKGTFIITGGGFGSDQGAQMAAGFGASSLALIKAAQRSYAISQATTAGDKFRVRCVSINGMVKATKEEDPVYNPEAIGEGFYKAHLGDDVVYNH